MNRALKIIGIVVGVVIVALIAIPFFVNVNTYKPQIESELSSALGRQVRVGNLSLSILGGSVAADDLAISDDSAFSSQPFLRAKELKVGVELLPLIFSKALHVTEITINEPQVTLLRNTTGKWNFSSLGNKPGAAGNPTGQATEAGKESPGEAMTAQRPATTEQAARPANKGETSPPSAAGSASSSNPDLSIGKLMVKNGTLSVATINANEKPRVYTNANITVEHFSFTSSFPFTLTVDLPGGGNAKLEGNAGPIDASDAALTAVQAKIGVNGLDLAASGFVTPDSGIAGVVNFDGTVTSNGHQAQADGSGNLAKWKVSPKGSPSPKPVDLKFSTHYELQKQSGTLNADVTVGKAVAKLTGTYETQGATTTLDMKLAADNMPVDDLEALLPAMGVTLPSGSRLEGGTLTANFTIQGPVDKLVINGPVQMVNTKLAGFDLGSKFSAISALSGAKTGQDTVIQNFSTDAHVSPQGIQTQNVNLNVPSIGLITGNGTISPQDALNYKMNAKLGGSASMVGGLTQMAGLGNKSGTIPFSIEGTTSDPKIVPDIKGMLGNQFNPAGKGSNPLSGISGLLGNKKH